MNAPNDDLMKRIALGAAAGVVGTAAIHALMVASQKFAPITVPLHRHDPGEFMVEQAEGVLPRETRYNVPAAAEKTAAVALSFGYGATFGALYGALRDRVDDPVKEGSLLGVLTWAVGYLGWLPATKITKPVWRENPIKTAGEIARHAVYGVATAATYSALEERLAD
jgi:hypothetical protein